MTHNRLVAGSSPAGATRLQGLARNRRSFFLWLFRRNWYVAKKSLSWKKSIFACFNMLNEYTEDHGWRGLKLFYAIHLSRKQHVNGNPIWTPPSRDGNVR